MWVNPYSFPQRFRPIVIKPRSFRQYCLHFNNDEQFGWYSWRNVGRGQLSLCFVSRPPDFPYFLLWTTTNLPGVSGNGLFDGGYISGLNPGSQISIQIKAWSAFAGNSYDDAYNKAISGGAPSAQFGSTPILNWTVPSGYQRPIEPFGSGPFQTGGFTLDYAVPEPSTYALCAIGVGLWARWFRRKRFV